MGKQTEDILVRDRITGEIHRELIASEAGLRFCYENPLGRVLLSCVAKKHLFSRLAGFYLGTGLSKVHIRPFVEKLKINMDEAVHNIEDFHCFNEFFVRKLRPQARPLANEKHKAVMPADGRALVWPTIHEDTISKIKGIEFRLSTLLQDKQLAASYFGGSMLIVRLCPTDYHRFHFPCDGTPQSAISLPGPLYSVNPISLCQQPDLLSVNERQYCLFRTKHFGTIACVEIGATIIGKIVQSYTAEKLCEKGDEKGYFLPGASTVLLLFEPHTIRFDQDLINNSSDGMETLVQFGQSLGVASQP